MTMKKTSKDKTKAKRVDGLRSEYSFDYSKAKPNRFAERIRPGSVAVLLVRPRSRTGFQERGIRECRSASVDSYYARRRAPAAKPQFP